MNCRHPAHGRRTVGAVTKGRRGFKAAGASRPPGLQGRRGFKAAGASRPPGLHGRRGFTAAGASRPPGPQGRRGFKAAGASRPPGRQGRRGVKAVVRPGSGLRRVWFRPQGVTVATHGASGRSRPMAARLARFPPGSRVDGVVQSPCGRPRFSRWLTPPRPVGYTPVTADAAQAKDLRHWGQAAHRRASAGPGSYRAAVCGFRVVLEVTSIGRSSGARCLDAHAGHGSRRLIKALRFYWYPQRYGLTTASQRRPCSSARGAGRAGGVHATVLPIRSGVGTTVAISSAWPVGFRSAAVAAFARPLWPASAVAPVVAAVPCVGAGAGSFRWFSWPWLTPSSEWFPQ